MKTFDIFNSEDHITEDAVRSSATNLLPPNTVLVVTRSGILRHTLPVAVARVPVTLNQDLKGITPHGGIKSAYLARALTAFGHRIIHSCTKDGTTVQSIETSLLQKFEIPLAPESEQQRIIDKLDELLSDLDAGVAALERVRAKLKHYRAAVLKAAVEGALTAEWRRQHPATETADALLTRILAGRRRRWEEAQLAKFEAAGRAPPKDWKSRYPEPATLEISGLAQLPETWRWVTIDQLSLEIRNGYSAKPNATAGVPILRISAVRPYSIDIDDRRYLSGSAEDYERDQIAEGDLLFTRYNGSRNLVGVCAVVPKIDEPIVHPDKIIRARPLRALPSSAFLGLSANVGTSRRYIEQRIRTTAGQAGISGGDVKSLPVPIPPAAEQAAIMDDVEAQLSVIEAIGRDIEIRVNSAQALRQSILRHAFTGQLVPQDPNDEPASELLSRIAAEREERSRVLRAAKQAKLKAKAPRRRATKE
jgi:type I restriction enzyme S subunit